jgi:hypothetical protein
MSSASSVSNFVPEGDVVDGEEDGADGEGGRAELLVMSLPLPPPPLPPPPPPPLLLLPLLVVEPARSDGEDEAPRKR